jgi:hypothetical protein
MLDAYEREVVIDALKKHRGIAAAAARDLQTTQRILNYRIRQLGIEPRSYRAPVAVSGSARRPAPDSASPAPTRDANA